MGIFRLDGGAVESSLLTQANSAQRHRGPDDEGYVLGDVRSGYAFVCGGRDTDARLDLPHIDLAQRSFDLALGFRRLAIVDLSPGGHQPMPNHAGTAWIVFNGEIYNYLELRRELTSFGYQFRTESDTEVLLAAYDRWGVDCPTHFNGMWAFAIWDSRKKMMFLSRDRFGEKPLHYVYEPGKFFAFASEMKALWATKLIGRQIHPETLLRWQRFGETDTGEQTFYRGISRLLQAHNVVVDADGTFRTWRYWDVEARPEFDASNEARCVDTFRELFTDSVRIRLRSDVPVGSSLSGGLDSSTVVCVMNELLPVDSTQKTFSARANDSVFDEGKWIDHVTSAKRVDAYQVVPTGDQFAKELSMLFWHQEEPFESTSMFAQWCVMRLAKRHGVTVLLDGQGADEMLAGYHQYFDDVAYGLLDRGDVLGYVNWRRTCARLHGRRVGPWGRYVKGLLPSRSKELLKMALGRHAGRGHLRPLTPEYPPELQGVSRLRRKLWWNTTRHGLNVLLRYADRNSMAHSREVRLPFLDHRLVEFVFKLPDRLILRNGYTKSILRLAFKDIVPPAITNRVDKIGYVMPQEAWTSGRSWTDVMTSELQRLTKESPATTTLEDATTLAFG